MKKRILALFLCLLMIIAVFAGCGSKADTRPDEEKIIGRWKWTFDAAKWIVFELEHQTGANLHSSTKLEYQMYIDFYPNGDSTIRADEACIEKMKPALTDYLKDIYRGDDFRAYLAEFAAEEGVDFDTALNTVAFADADVFSSDYIGGEACLQYKIENGKLYFDFFGEGALTYKFSGNKLIIKDTTLYTEYDESPALGDITLTRVS